MSTLQQITTSYLLHIGAGSSDSFLLFAYDKGLDVTDRDSIAIVKRAARHPKYGKKVEKLNRQYL